MKSKGSVVIFLLGLIVLVSCKQNVKIKNISGSLLDVDTTIVADTVLSKIIKPYREDIDKQMDRVIGYNMQELDSYFPESPLSNFVSDIIQERALNYLKSNNSDTLSLITLMNIRGLRASLPQGEISVRNIFEVMPFENQIVVLTLPGEDIEKLFKYISSTNGEGISGARIEIKEKKLKKLTIEGQPFDIDKNYFLATSDYLANGGDYFSMITNPVKREMIGCKIREAIIEYIEALSQEDKKVVCSIDGRVKID